MLGASLALVLRRVIARPGRPLLTAYSVDDWLAYQIAGYRIYMNGNWLEGGTPAFDYQMLYRWITGGLHLVFGDSSVGEIYWDASSLLIGALLAFHLAHRHAGFQWGIAAAALMLATMTLSTALVLHSAAACRKFPQPGLRFSRPRRCCARAMAASRGPSRRR